MYRCRECYWCTLNSMGSTDRVCCNTESKNYNKIITKEEYETLGCEQGESEQAIDYRRLNAWEFANKYYN